MSSIQIHPNANTHMHAQPHIRANTKKQHPHTEAKLVKATDRQRVSAASFFVLAMLYFRLLLLCISQMLQNAAMETLSIPNFFFGR